MFHDDGSLTRSGLFFDALRIIEATRPKVAIAENVKNLVGKKFTEQFAIILQSLEDAGYNNYWKVLNAKDYGIPQNRERVFIVSIRKDIDTGVFEFPEAFPLELRLKDVLEDQVDEKYYVSDKAINYITTPTRLDKKYTQINGDVALCLTAKGNNNWTGTFISDEPKVTQIGNCCPTKTRDNPNQGRIYDTNGLSPALNCMEGGNRQPFVVPSFINGDSCKTVRASGHGSLDRHSWDMVYDDLRIRKLTPKECFRLMGFDDADVDLLTANGISNTQLYKQAGNSIVVDVLECLFCQMFDSEDELWV